MRRVEYTGNGPSETHLDRKWDRGAVRTFIPDPMLGGYNRKKNFACGAKTQCNSLLFFQHFVRDLVKFSTVKKREKQ